MTYDATMPIKDPEKRRERNRESQRRRRAEETAVARLGDDRDFSKWFDLTTRVLQLELRRAWADYLDEVIDADDVSLRRLAKGEIKSPRLATTYKIGEGLRKAGIPWSSGLYALYQHPKHFVEVYSVLDSVGSDPTLFTRTFDWMDAAINHRAIERGLAVYHRRLSDQDFARSTMPVRARLEDFSQTRVLVEETAFLQKAIATAWKAHPKKSRRGAKKTQKAHGFFGGLYRIQTDPYLAPSLAQQFYQILDRERVSMLRPDQREKIKLDREFLDGAMRAYEERHERALRLLDGSEAE